MLTRLGKGLNVSKFALACAVLSLIIPTAAICGCTTKTVTVTAPNTSVETFIFVTQPGGAEAGYKFVKQPVVKVVDSQGIFDSHFNGLVTLSIASNLNPTGTGLMGTTTVLAVDGIATFTDLSIDLPGNGYALWVTSGSMTPILSAVFDVGILVPPSTSQAAGSG